MNKLVVVIFPDDTKIDQGVDVISGTTTMLPFGAGRESQKGVGRKPRANPNGYVETFSSTDVLF
jgi:hypothetical protein